MNAVLFLIAFSSSTPTVQESTLERIEREVSAVVEKTRPSVVQVIARHGDEQFQSSIAAPITVQSSGFVVSPDGYILTDLGGVESSRDISVTLNDGRRLDAVLKAFDRATAVALLRVKAAGLACAEFADEPAIRQGTIAVLVSNPAGLKHSCSVGFVNGVDRSIRVGGRRYDDMIQTSAAVLSGDCGGLLANSKGQVVGMIHSRYVSDGLNTDPAGFLRPIPRGGVDFLPASGPAVGFATPATTLRFVAERLMKHGQVVRGWAGLGLRGAVVTEVTREGPAWKAGIRRGDSLVEFDGLPATHLLAIRRRVIETAPPKLVRVRVLRGNAPLEMDLTLESEPGP